MNKFMCEEITNKMLKIMEEGIIPWERPWFGVRGGAIKYSDGQPYSFLNQLLLFEEGEYIGYKACTTAGGICLKNHGRRIYHYSPPIFERDENDELKLIKKGHYTATYVWRIGTGTLNIERRWSDPLPDSILKPDKQAEVVVDKYLSNNPELVIQRDQGSNRAYYSPTTDSIVVPMIEQFSKISEYYSTLFHEMTHSTGAKHRLDRLTDDEQFSFGSESYSKEELVAEIGAASLLNFVGLDTNSSLRNSSGYLQGWMSKLKKDPTLIVNAIKLAETACNYILDIKKEVK